MLRYCFVLMVLTSPNTWGQDSIANGSMANITAVSYTHLDVYKRQIQPCDHLGSIR